MNMVQTHWCARRFHALVSFVALVTWPGSLFGTGYEPGDPPTMAEARFEPMAVLPDIPNRAEFGIRETIRFWVDPGTWVDNDVYVDDLENQTVVSDTMGEIAWYWEPAGHTAAGEFLPTTGEETFFTAPWSDFDDYVRVWAQVADSGAAGVDSPLMLENWFTLRVPNGNMPYFWADSALGTPGPPNNSMGVKTRFVIQVLPETVNFDGIEIQEQIAAQTFQWPEGTNYSVPASQASAPLGSIVVGGQARQSCFVDDVSTGGPWEIARLTDPLTLQTVDAEFVVVQRIHFQSSALPTFIFYEETTHPRSFSGTTYAARVGWVTGAGAAGAATQVAQGPYREQGL